jgi:hypothetical protein
MRASTIYDLLNDRVEHSKVRDDLIRVGRNRAWSRFLHVHHIEPERIETINLTPLEHLAIHICLAKLNPSDSNRAKVSCFVKPYPGTHDYTPIKISDDLQSQVLSFGQSRRDSCDRTLTYARTFIDKDKQREAVREAAKRHKGRKCEWSDQISTTMLNTPLCSCIICHKQMKAISGNITQHQRSKSCKK